MSPSLAGGRRLGLPHPWDLPQGHGDQLHFPPAVTVASSEQNPVLTITVVAIAGLTVLVSMVIGVMVWRR